MALEAVQRDVDSLDGTVTGTLDVCIVGAGPAGLMLADNLARFGIISTIIDERPDQTSTGRADGLQPKTIETLRMLRLADELIRVSTKVYDICIWGQGDDDMPLRRLGRQIHYPDSVVDVLDPYILLCHQGMVEGTLIRAMKERGVEVQRSTRFQGYQTAKNGTLTVTIQDHGSQKSIQTHYLVGCDGAHSNVRKAIPGAIPEGSSSESVWGVLDGEVATNFPDIWSKTVVFHPQKGSILIIPRERGMTRFYIELKGDTGLGEPINLIDQEDVMERARQICAPYRLMWKTVEWFGRYQIGQRVANKFMDATSKVIIAGDASHTHSPKAAQGMNTSVHDSWNLGWKLNLEVRGLAKPILLETYEEERRKIAQDLINFDFEHANSIAAGDSEALAENFRINTRFISGVGVEYSNNILNHASHDVLTGALKPGSILPPSKVIRYVDHNPVDVQLDIPILGQFRIYVLVHDVIGSTEGPFLEDLSRCITSSSSLLSRISAAAQQSYARKPRLEGKEDVYFRHDRYNPISDMFTFALITTTEKTNFEIERLPTIFCKSPWTIYLDTIPSLNTKGMLCTAKWLGSLRPGEVAIVNVRPDNYVGSMSVWNSTAAGTGTEASKWLDTYYSGFLKV